MQADTYSAVSCTGKGEQNKEKCRKKVKSTQILFEARLWFSPSTKQRCKPQKPHCPVSSSTCLSMCWHLILSSLCFSMLRGKTSTKVTIRILTCKLAPYMKPTKLSKNFNKFLQSQKLKKKTPKLWKRMGKLLEYLFSTSNKTKTVCHSHQLELLVRTVHLSTDHKTWEKRRHF